MYVCAYAFTVVCPHGTCVYIYIYIKQCIVIHLHIIHLIITKRFAAFRFKGYYYYHYTATTTTTAIIIITTNITINTTITMLR